MSKRKTRDRIPGWRPAGDDRRLGSVHDWYGFGFLYGLTGQHPGRWRHIGKRAQEEQFVRGALEGERVKDDRD